jgi:chitin disaccharide deacetylase
MTNKLETEKLLIINADDFGMDRSTNQGILESFNAGVVSSASLIVNGSAFSEAVKTSLDLGIPVGIHLNSSAGMPLSSVQEIPTLVNRSTGLFDSFPTDPSPSELAIEYKRQIEKGLESGLKPTHLDNHHSWIYFRPDCLEVVLKLASEYDLPVRNPFDITFPKKINKLAERYGVPQSLATHVYLANTNLFQSLEIRSPDYFDIEFTSIHRSSHYLVNYLQSLPNGITEICTHPGRSTWRQRNETDILLSNEVSDLIQGYTNFKLTSFKVFEE